MKPISLLLLLVVMFIPGLSRNRQKDTAKSALPFARPDLSISKQDTDGVKALINRCINFEYINRDSSLYYGQRALYLARNIGYSKGEANALIEIGINQVLVNNFSEAVKVLLNAEQIAERNNLVDEQANAFDKLGVVYDGMNNYRKSLGYFKKSLILFNSAGDKTMPISVNFGIAGVFLEMNQLDSALYYNQSAYNGLIKYKTEWWRGLILYTFGMIQSKQGNLQLALNYFKACIIFNNKNNIRLLGPAYSIEIARIYQKLNRPDSCIYYATKSLNDAQADKDYKGTTNASNFLMQFYEKPDAQKALIYSKLAISANDSLYNYEKTYAFKNITAFDEQERQYEIETETNKIKQYSLLAGLVIFLLIGFLLYGNNRQKRKANNLLQSTLTHLKSTQNQLIQSEKMASLGELTAGIAHEIQNPLNFVNNFSEVSIELLDELKQEAEAGNKEDVIAIAGDLTQNLEKIHHHGKRADGIVKGMLQHSQAGSNVKEPTDINKLADDYLKLAYNNLKAKDKDFEAEIITRPDPALPQIMAVPQDISRVLLNLFNNAFYAVNQKLKAAAADYRPEVSVSTASENRQVVIKVKDNGTGIPDSIKEKIMQPFFTTKPTGEGTGLGLSLTYDMVVKGHGGSIQVNSKVGEGSEFIISLPI